MTDEEIVALYFARSEEAVAATERQYGAYCRRIARTILLSDEDADECLNDTLLAAWRSIPPAKPQSLAAYLGRTARNLASNRFKLYSAQKRGGSETALALDELGDCVPSSGSVEEELDAALLSDAISRFLRAEPEEKRRVFVRRYWYLSPLEEIAAEYGMSRSKLTSLLYRMRKDLKKFLAKEGFHI